MNKSLKPLWKNVAHSWNNYGPPIRPCEEDISIMEKVVAKWTRFPGQTLRAVLWGVTPEIADMEWPYGTELLAIERSEDMVREVWPGDIDGFRRAFCCNWLDAYSVIKSPVSIVIGDGCFSIYNYPGDYRALFAVANQVLKEPGIFIMRFFLRPETRESPDKVIRELMENRIGNFHVFKFRLAMALQENAQKGVRHHDIWQTWKDAPIETDELMKITGWRKEAISTIDLLEGFNTRLSFPTYTELKPVFSDIFSEIDMTVPKYEMGERFPILVFQKKEKNNP
ncbi:class I SAM-dependent methyltransferase [Thermodesulfobacteriota bacterium]